MGLGFVWGILAVCLIIGAVVSRRDGTVMRLWLALVGALILLIISSTALLHELDRSLPALLPTQVLWESKEKLLLRCNGDMAPMFDKLVDRPDWLKLKSAPAPRKSLTGQTWLVEEKIEVAGQTLKQPMLLTYSAFEAH